MRLGVPVALSLLAAAVVGTGTASAQISDDVVRIGVLNDQSNVYADLGGQGSVIAARMAIEDVGGKVLGKPIDILVADHQSKADVGASIARQWFDSEKVDLAIGFDNSSVALAVEQVAFQKNRIAIAGAIGTTAFTGKACTPNEAAWVYDAYALTNTLARSVVKARPRHLVLYHRRLFTRSFVGGRCHERGLWPAAERSWAARVILSTPPISAHTCCRRRHPEQRLSRWQTPAAT